jgi:hypothetical protein
LPTNPASAGGPPLSALRASAARLDPDHSLTYRTADRRLWQQAADTMCQLLVLSIWYQRKDLDGAAYRRSVAQLLHRTDETLLIAALTWQLQAFPLPEASEPSAPGDQGDPTAHADGPPAGA